jgi:hypothetical protein
LINTERCFLAVRETVRHPAERERERERQRQTETDRQRETERERERPVIAERGRPSRSEGERS